MYSSSRPSSSCRTTSGFKPCSIRRAANSTAARPKRNLPRTICPGGMQRNTGCPRILEKLTERRKRVSPQVPGRAGRDAWWQSRVKRPSAQQPKAIRNDRARGRCALVLRLSAKDQELLDLLGKSRSLKPIRVRQIFPAPGRCQTARNASLQITVTDIIGYKAVTLPSDVSVRWGVEAERRQTRGTISRDIRAVARGPNRGNRQGHDHGCQDAGSPLARHDKAEEIKRRHLDAWEGKGEGSWTKIENRTSEQPEPVSLTPPAMGVPRPRVRSPGGH